MRTETQVHSQAASIQQRKAAAGEAYHALWGLMLFAQVTLYGTLVILPQCANGAWWLAAGLTLPALLLGWSIRWLLPRRIPLRSVFRDALGPWGAALVGILYGLIFWLDLSAALCGLTELTSAFVIEDGGVWPMALWGAAASAVAVWVGRERGAARCCYLLRWVLMVALAGCVAAALLMGEKRFLLAQQKPVLTNLQAGSGWLGSLWPVLLMEFSPVKEKTQKRWWAAILWPVSAAALLFVAYCIAMPPSALAGALTWGERMVQFMRGSPSKWMWETLLLLKMSVFFLNLIGGAALGGRILNQLVAGGIHPGIWASALLLAAIPLAGLHGPAGLTWLAKMLPWRLPAALIPLLGAVGIRGLRARRRL